MLAIKCYNKVTYQLLSDNLFYNLSKVERIKINCGY